MAVVLSRKMVNLSALQMLHLSVKRISQRTKPGMPLTGLGQRTFPKLPQISFGSPNLTRRRRSIHTLSTCSCARLSHLEKAALRNGTVYLQGRHLSSESKDGDGESSESEPGNEEVKEKISEQRDQHPKIQAAERFRSVHRLLDEAQVQTPISDPFDFSNVPQRTEIITTERHLRPGNQRQKQDPREMTTFLFPGQGSQFVGMGRQLLKYPNVREMYSVASDILGYDLLDLSLNGSQEELNRTVHSQPAVVVCSLAAVEKLKEEQPKAVENCVSAVGFSVGEFSALVFSGALMFEDAIHLIKVRAEAMQRASELVPSGMLHVIGRPGTRFKTMCREAADTCIINGMTNPVCMIASHVYPEAKVVAGNVEALNFIQEMSRHYSIRSAKRVPVSGAFHSPLMAPAHENFSSAVDKVLFETPVISVHSNVNGKKYRHPKHIKTLLKRQMLEPVHWEQTMHEVYQRRQGRILPKDIRGWSGKTAWGFLRKNNAKALFSYIKVEV